jgi:hypothetical protein
MINSVREAAAYLPTVPDPEHERTVVEHWCHFRSLITAALTTVNTLTTGIRRAMCQNSGNSGIDRSVFCRVFYAKPNNV